MLVLTKAEFETILSCISFARGEDVTYWLDMEVAFKIMDHYPELNKQYSHLREN